MKRALGGMSKNRSGMKGRGEASFFDLGRVKMGMKGGFLGKTSYGKE